MIQTCPLFGQVDMTTKDVWQLTLMAIVPFVAVFVARLLGRRDEKRHKAVEALSRISSHAENYRHAFVSLLYADAAMNTEDRRDQKTQDKYHDAAGVLREATTALNSDLVLVRLLFGRKGATLEKEMKAAVDLAQKFEGKAIDGSEVGPLRLQIIAINERTNAQILTVWKRLNRWCC